MSVLQWASNASGYITYAAFRMYFSNSKDSKPSSINKISPDLWIDHIFPYCLVEDLVRFRQSSKFYYLLTHEPAIWKRYLERMRIPVQQMRPTLQYKELIANYEIENFVTSACALDRSWRKGEPVIWREQIHASQYRVIDMKMVPGGKFLVASVRDRKNFRFFILVYALDVLFGSRMLARVPTGYKAFNLQVKYMKHQGTDGLMISYIRRRFRNGVPLRARDNINNFYHATPISLPYSAIYEACSIHMRLDSVEILISPAAIPQSPGKYTGIARGLEAPFKDVYIYESGHEIHSLTLFHVDGVPCMAFVEEQATQSVIHVRPINGTSFATLECTDFIVGAPHRIRSIRYLPSQKGFLVVRTIRQLLEAADIILFEIYDLPSLEGDQLVLPIIRWDYADQWYLSGEFIVSDAETEKTSEDHPDILKEEEGPPTIWVFAPSDQGCMFWWFRATPAPEARGDYRYQFHGGGFHQNDHYSETAFPGVERTLYLEFEKGIEEAKKLRRIRRFNWPSYRFPVRHLVPDYGIPVTERAEERGLCLVNIACSEHIGGIINDSGGLIAMAWDETSGKICLAGERDEHIRILDMAPIAETHKKLAYRWAKGMLIPKDT